MDWKSFSELEIRGSVQIGLLMVFIKQWTKYFVDEIFLCFFKSTVKQSKGGEGIPKALCFESILWNEII